MRREDPSSSPNKRDPQNRRGMWRCPQCGIANDPDEDTCWYCEKKETRP